MFDAQLVLAVVGAVPDAVIDGGWGIDALVERQTREHDDLDLVVRSNTVGAVLDALAALGFTEAADERPARVVASRADGCRVDLHLVEQTSSGTTQQLPGGHQFTYFLDDTTGAIDGQRVRCISAEMQLLTHTGYEPDEDDYADVAHVAALSGLALPPPYAPPLDPGATVKVREATVEDVPAVCVVRRRSWRAAYAGLMPQPVIDSLDLGTMWSTWRASVARPPAPAMQLFIGGPPGEVHSYAFVRPADASRDAGQVAAVYSDPTAWGTQAGWAVFSRAVDHLHSHGFTDLSLWMLKGNERAGRFYERAGWRPDGEEETVTTTAGSYVEVRYRLVES
jgi:RimJ/RimL family protein N-acetyltransferase